jgi:hypothetical protein
MQVTNEVHRTLSRSPSTEELLLGSLGISKIFPAKHLHQQASYFKMRGGQTIAERTVSPPLVRVHYLPRPAREPGGNFHCP